MPNRESREYFSRCENMKNKKDTDFRTFFGKLNFKLWKKEFVFNYGQSLRVGLTQRTDTSRNDQNTEYLKNRDFF